MTPDGHRVLYTYQSTALNESLIEMTILGATRSSKRRYVLTPAGRKFLSQPEEKQ